MTNILRCRPRVLFVDAYDSFANNIVSLLTVELGVDVVKIQADASIDDLATFLRPFAAVVAGPGPGTATNANDVGLMRKLWHLPSESQVPVLGICLGFQSLVVEHGGCISPLPVPHHGVRTTVTTSGQSIFAGLDSLSTVLYHSLQAIVGNGVSSSDTSLWQPSKTCPDLLPLAWHLTTNTEADDLPFEHDSGPILMAVRHVTKPFWGVQFHPESICSSPQARSVVRNWWVESQRWTSRHQTDSKGPEPQITQQHSKADARPDNNSAVIRDFGLELFSRSTPVGNLNVEGICAYLQAHSVEYILLDSEARQTPDLSTHTIIGLLDAQTSHYEYTVGQGCIRWHRGSKSSQSQSIRMPDGIKSVFAYLKHVLAETRIAHGPTEVPFWGGLVGYISYEAGLETIDQAEVAGVDHPDVHFAMVERSLVIDHVQGRIHLQSIRRDDQRWVDELMDDLHICGDTAAPTGSQPMDRSPADQVQWKRQSPDQKRYEAQVEACMEQIRRGNSYQLCLTDQTVCRTDCQATSTWELYRRLRRTNPAPFGAFLALGDLLLLSSSPERFLRWSRPRQTNKTQSVICRFSPMKGTVAKVQHENGHERRILRDEAERILATPKERAENLMIVDLIRHDLHGVVGPGHVHVPALMTVQEHEHVYQLVSTIEGTLDGNNASGVDVLAASLPPGSMTGAPKRRTCELLRQIEGSKPRGLYAGVLGYMDVGGGGDFSVIIRSATSWDQGRTWQVGAGGGVTALSTGSGEYEEMMAKLESVMRVF